MRKPANPDAVVVGRAFTNEPDLVLIEEPTSALDTKLGEQVMELIVGEVRARNSAAVIVTHDQRMTRYADHTLTITDGILKNLPPRAAGQVGQC